MILPLGAGDLPHQHSHRPSDLSKKTAFSGSRNRGTESEVAAQILPSWGPKENAPKKWSILSINTWGKGRSKSWTMCDRLSVRIMGQVSIKTWDDRFYQPLPVGQQNLAPPAALANFSILACTIVGTFKHFGPLKGGGGGGGGGGFKDCTWAPPVVLTLVCAPPNPAGGVARCAHPRFIRIVGGGGGVGMTRGWIAV